MARRLLLFICFLQFFNVQLFASPPKTLVVPVVFTVENGTYDLSYVVVKKNGETLFTKTGEKNLKLKLEYGNEYLLSFSKEGYITKQILLNTSVPEGIDTNAIEPYKIGVRIFKQYEGVNIVIYNQPVGFIHFMAEEEGFGYDTDYTKSILSELETTENILIQKAKEEKEKLESEQKLKSKEEKKETIKSNQNQKEDVKTNLNNNRPDNLSTNVNDSIIHESDKSKHKISGFQDQENPSKNLGKGEGEDGKSKISIDAGEDKIQQHLYVASEEEPISENKVLLPEVETVTKEIVEKNRKITEVEVYFEEKKSIIRKVVYNWGGVYYYNVDNKVISEDQFYSIIKSSKKIISK